MRNEKGQFIKGNRPWTKDKKFPEKSGKNHFAWKGQKASYNAIHHWIQRQLGTPKQCEKCGKNNLSGKFINWANKSGKYIRNINDWIRLCRKCHHKFDNISIKMWKVRL